MSNDNHRPWGYFEVLSNQSNHNVKRIVVNNSMRLSYQYHKKRSEHWFIVTGEAVVTLEGETVELKPGDSINIPRGFAHRIKNSGNSELVFIEVQTGEYFGEDDIFRLEDDFGRIV